MCPFTSKRAYSVQQTIPIPHLRLAYPVVVEPQSGERGDGRAGCDVLEVVLIQHERLQRGEASEVRKGPAAKRRKKTPRIDHTPRPNRQQQQGSRSTNHGTASEARLGRGSYCRLGPAITAPVNIWQSHDDNYSKKYQGYVGRVLETHRRCGAVRLNCCFKFQGFSRCG